MSWIDDLRPASLRGVPFGVWGNDNHFGRRAAIHEYPFRDQPWAEDLGRAIPRHTIVGFIVGDDVAQQQDALIEAAEAPGEAELVHPSLGLRRVTVLDLGTAARHDLGRVIEITLTCIETGERAFPTAEFATAWGVLEAADLADSASLTDFATRAQNAVRRGAAVAEAAQKTVQKWTGTARRLIGSAGNLLNSVGSLVPGAGKTFSRFIGGRRSPLAAADRALSTVNLQLSRVARSRRAAAQAADDVEDLARRL
ncbi:DNA circularization N-terminal domain-containing protein [Roseomonas sp. USHLN139]|uniref:DNA circularization N-terminal domain-containing protein n=1 Tax=Roseomonas sp. USHLN139 TaxID=3081298 RepID=UPI003B012378